MKTKINQFVVFALFALLLLGGNVSAKGTEMASSLENIIEPSLVIKDWMLNDNCWNTWEATFNFNEAVDENLELENWMTDEKTWNLKAVCYFETVVDQQLEIELWMTNENVWNR